MSPTARRYTPDEKAQAVRLVRTLRDELGTRHGTIQRIASQLGYGVESLRSWVHQADVDDGLLGGTTTSDAQKLKELEQEVEELRRANAAHERDTSQGVGIYVDCAIMPISGQSDGVQPVRRWRAVRRESA